MIRSSITANTINLRHSRHKFLLTINVKLCQYGAAIQFNIVVTTLGICNRRQGLQPLTGLAE